jgi:hypothetical protein
MARSPIFLFMIIAVVVVAFVFLAAELNLNQPNTGAYVDANSSINHTAKLVYGAEQAAPNWLIPGIFVGLALALISVLFLFGRRR